MTDDEIDFDVGGAFDDSEQGKPVLKFDGSEDFTGWTRAQIKEWDSAFYLWSRWWKSKHPMPGVGIEREVALAISERDRALWDGEPMVQARKRRDRANDAANKIEREKQHAVYLADQERSKATDPRLLMLATMSAVLVKWRDWLRRASPRRDMNRKMIADVIEAGLKSAGLDVGHAAGSEWVRRGERWTKATLDYVLEMPCPIEEHAMHARTTESVQLLVAVDGNVDVDRENSTCPRCDDHSVWRVLLRCPMCQWDEWDDTHRPGHGLYQWFDDNGQPHGSRAPWAFVVARFEMMMMLAEMQWRIDHADDVSEPDLIEARELLAKQPKKKAGSGGPPKPKRSDAEEITFLEQHGVPATASASEAWRIVGPLPGRPTKRRVFELQPTRVQSP